MLPGQNGPGPADRGRSVSPSPWVRELTPGPAGFPGQSPLQLPAQPLQQYGERPLAPMEFRAPSLAAAAAAAEAVMAPYSGSFVAGAPPPAAISSQLRRVPDLSMPLQAVSAPFAGAAHSEPGSPMLRSCNRLR